MEDFSRREWDVYSLGRGDATPSAPLSWPLEAVLIAFDATIRAFVAKRSLMTAPGLLIAAHKLSRFRAQAERSRGRELGLTAWGAPRPASSTPVSSLVLLALNLWILFSRRLRGVRSAQADWSLVLASKVVKELDRRRSWRAAGGGYGAAAGR